MLVKCNECDLGKLIVQLSCYVTGYKSSELVVFGQFQSMCNV